ncbi:MAG TPA: DUF962 domain-containing protein [Chloroflexota bacterium]|jgi:hypothetical protein
MFGIIGNYLRAYMSNHTDPRNRVLHLIGVPLAPWGAIVLLIRGDFLWAIGAFFVGYGLQWFGHRAEGNVMGDLVLAKQLFGYVTGRRRA